MIGLGNLDKPKYLFVTPHLRKDGKPCSQKTIDYFINCVEDASEENTGFISWIQEYRSKIYANDRKTWTPVLKEFIENKKPQIVITMGTDLSSYLLDWPAYERMNQNHGTYYVFGDSYIFPIHHFSKRKSYEYRQVIDYDLKFRLNLDINSLHLPEYELVDSFKQLDIPEEGICYLDIESAGLSSAEDEIIMVGISFNKNEKVFVIPRPTNETIYWFLDKIKKFKIVGHNIKFDLHFLLKKSNYNLNDYIFKFEDTLLLSQILGESQGWQNLKHLSNKYNLRLGNNAYKGKEGFESVEYLVEDVHTTRLLYKNLSEKIENDLC